MEFRNSYEDPLTADAYSKLEFPGTYYLAFRDLPFIISAHVNGKKALDFGCGAGRSTRFLQKIGFDTIGVDISQEMIKKSKDIDPCGNYLLIKDGKLSDYLEGPFDFILSAFTFDNIPAMEKKVLLFKDMVNLLSQSGRIINLVSSPDIYKCEWTSFSTKDFPENTKAKCGDVVKIINTEIYDKRPVEDIIWPDKDYRELYSEAGLKIIKIYKPLATGEEPYEWINETAIAPWVIYVLKKDN